MSSPNPTNQQSSHIPTQFRAISRNNSNTSTASSSNKADLSSTISTVNSVTSSRSQLTKHQQQQLIDHRQLFATCGGSSTPIRSFQRATISSVVKTRAFDNNPVLQGLLTSASPSGQNSVSNSQTPSPHSTPIFSRSRSLRMSGGPQRYQNSPSHIPQHSYSYRTKSRTPELYSFNSGDITNESQIKLVELNNEKLELKESLEFLECERQVLIDTSNELKDALKTERNQWKKEQDELKKQLTEQMRIRVMAESQLTGKEVEINDLRLQNKKLSDELTNKSKVIDGLEKKIEKTQEDNRELFAINNELKHMLTEKLKFNGINNNALQNDATIQQVSDCTSIVTEMARLRLELNEKERIIDSYNNYTKKSENFMSSNSDIDILNKFLDQTVECIKNWPDELASSSHVQDLMKTLLSAYKKEPDELSTKLENIHL